MNWTELKNEEQITVILEESKIQPVLIFKHSTTCSISRTALDRLERSWNQEGFLPMKAYFLDLLSYRKVSNQIAKRFIVEHESPQVLVVQNGKPVYVRSHFNIGFDEIRQIALAKN